MDGLGEKKKKKRKIVKRFRGGKKTCSKAALVKREALLPNICWWYFECSDVEKNTLIVLAEQSTYCV